MTLRQALEYLSSFVNYEKLRDYPYRQSLKLRRMEDFLQFIGSPQSAFPCVHIAGSKGKGSVSALCAYILRAAGYRTGLYTSPHLSDWRERIRILHPRISSGRRGEDFFEGMISRADFCRLVAKLKPQIERFNRKSRNGRLTFFEVTTALAFLYFKQKKVEIAVLETGLGGRLDATNTVKALVCGIAPISYEHTQKLGKTLAKIAGEKAGIIKRSARVVSARQPPEAMRVIKQRCLSRQARLWVVGKDIRLGKQDNPASIAGLRGTYRGIKLRLLGGHQLENAALAIGLAESVAESFPRIGEEAIRRGLKEALWPARAELLRKNPSVVLDGAQNGASVQAILKTLKESFIYRRLIVVLGISSDKEIADICRPLAKKSWKVVLTRADTNRAAELGLMEKYFPAASLVKTSKVADALKYAFSLARGNDLILVTGSLFVTAEAREILKKK